jgi:hypothetical protein
MQEPASSAAHTRTMAELPGFTPSVNRSIIAGIPGLPAGLSGARAFDWLSSVGIARRVRERLPGIDLAPVPDGLGPDVIIAAAPYPRALDALVAAGDPTATGLADDLGVALAGLVAVLVLGPPEARAARRDWPVEHWERWAAVRRIGLGGGIASGALGRRMVTAANAWLPRLGADDARLAVADDPGSLALRGAATRLPDGRAVLVDAGLTSIKRGLADVHGGRCVTVTTMSAVAPPGRPRAGALADFLADAAADVVPGPSVSSAGFAIAADVDATGQPPAGQPGYYGSLGMVPLERRLADRLRDRLGHPVAVAAVNDGDAAAAAMAGAADAVIMLGTAIGVGLNV